MKKILLMLLFPVMMFSQEISTTEDEYAYLTKGIREQYSNGLDVKKEGYSLEKFFEKKSPNSDAVYTFYKFLDSSKNLKAISIITKVPNGKSSNGNYYCYPINNSKLMKKHLKLIDSFMAEDNFIEVTMEAVIYLLKKENH